MARTSAPVQDVRELWEGAGERAREVNAGLAAADSAGVGSESVAQPLPLVERPGVSAPFGRDRAVKRNGS